MTENRFKDPKHINWAKEVKNRDAFKCQLCGKTDTYLHSHHLNSFDKYIEQRYDISNGITLCGSGKNSCHNLFHSIYGHGGTTKFQFEEFKQFFFLIKKIAKDNL